MNQWSNETLEERVLLNPAFCANLIWQFASAAGGEVRHVTFLECFVLLPMVLHATTREALPRSTRTSLSVWLNDNPTARSAIARRARILVPFTKDALLFGSAQSLFHFESSDLIAHSDWTRKIKSVVRRSTAEVQACMKRAAFVGTWFSETGTPTTVMALIGVRP